MHRAKSLEPFTRHFSGQQFLDMLELHEQGQSTSISVKPDSVDVLAPILLKYKRAQDSNKLLYINFTSVSLSNRHTKLLSLKVFRISILKYVIPKKQCFVINAKYPFLF